ncbi:MAG: FAD-dependent oxidoreductase, partial [Litorimonas sp.]
NYARPDMALPNMPVMDAATRSALTVFEDHIRLSGTWNEPDEMALLTRWRDIAPHVMERLASPLFHWSAHRPVSRAGRPYISATSIPHIWINTGHGHLGWTLCAASAELMARMILDGDVDKRFFYSG